MGLKSLIDIKRKYGRKKRHIFSKKQKNKAKNGEFTRTDWQRKTALVPANYWQKAILKQLQKFTKNVEQIKTRLIKLRRN
ncbi:MAG: hypothetical protein HQ538_05515 [Parcubacteria group bacterium]|nr:hypothetical protein [Parcubacteria group bacterium]